MPTGLEGGELGGLVAVHIVTGEVADHELDGDEDGDEAEAPVQHDAGFGQMAVAQAIPGAGGDDAHAGGEEGAKQHVRPAHAQHRAGDDLPPVGGDDVAVDDGVADRDLHPGVVAEDPERRGHGAEGDHAAGEEVEARRDAATAEHDDAEEGGFQQEGGEAFVAEQRALDGAGALGHHAPVGAELEGHDDAADHAHAEGEGEDLEPEVEDAAVDGAAGGQRHAFQRGKPGGEADGEGREDDVEADDEAELDAGEEDRIECHVHRTLRKEES